MMFIVMRILNSYEYFKTITVPVYLYDVPLLTRFGWFNIIIIIYRLKY